MCMKYIYETTNITVKYKIRVINIINIVKIISIIA